jgi:hypothetical protein
MGPDQVAPSPKIKPGVRFGLVSVEGAGSAGARASETNMTVRTAVKASKHDALLKLLHGNKGATMAQMQKATGWRAHSVRGFLSGTIKKRLGLALRSEEDRKGQRRYLIAEG